MSLFFQSPTSPRLNVLHLQQPNLGECLATCTAMVLAYYKVSYDYRQLIKTLRIQPELGTPFSNITKLAELGLLVGFRENGRLETLHRLLTQGWPCLIAVDTGELPYWHTRTGHAVVLVGMDKHHVYLNDPAMTVGPLQVPIDDFYLAWQEYSLSYAVLNVP
jgi:ABC-type bacteriocin/lantibiotic exporter with double-glycine peptidase domain